MAEFVGDLRRVAHGGGDFGADELAKPRPQAVDGYFHGGLGYAESARGLGLRGFRVTVEPGFRPEVNRNSGAAAFTFTGLSAMWALLGDGDRALHELHRFMKWPDLCANSMYQEGNNPCFESPVYSAHNIHELLLQCYDEFPENGALTATIRVFPAVPTTWADAVFHNLRTPGAFLVSAVRKGGVTQWVRVKSLAGEPCRIKPNLLPGPVRVAGKRTFALQDLGDGIYTLDLKKGEEALLYTGETVPVPTIEPLPAQDGRCNRYGLK